MYKRQLPKDKVVAAEVENVKALGVDIETNVVIGKSVKIDELMEKEGFEAVFIGSGAGLPRFMGIPGETANGVFSANEYLTRSNLMKAFDDATVYQRQLAQETEENQLKQVLADGADIVVTYIDDLTPFQEAVAGVYDKYKQTALKPYIEALEAAKAKVSE